jgi:hypothetical protein
MVSMSRMGRKLGSPDVGHKSPLVGGVGCCIQRRGQLPHFRSRDERIGEAADRDPALDASVCVLRADDGYHDVIVPPVVGVVLDDPLLPVEAASA